MANSGALLGHAVHRDAALLLKIIRHQHEAHANGGPQT